jgi:hypothetical protein
MPGVEQVFQKDDGRNGRMGCPPAVKTIGSFGTGFTAEGCAGVGGAPKEIFFHQSRGIRMGGVFGKYKLPVVLGLGGVMQAQEEGAGKNEM